MSLCEDCRFNEAEQGERICFSCRHATDQTNSMSAFVSKKLVLEWLGGYAGPQEPEFFGEFLNKLEWRIKNEADSFQQITPEMIRSGYGPGTYADHVAGFLNRKLSTGKKPMTWIRIDDHRINVEEIVRYSNAIGTDSSKFKSEIELSSGSVVFVSPTPEELDVMIAEVLTLAQK